MKGKNWEVKVLSFAVLLGLGLPHQSWFRNTVLFNMDSAYPGGSILMLVVGMVFMTFFFRLRQKVSLGEKNAKQSNRFKIVNRGKSFIVLIAGQAML